MAEGLWYYSQGGQQAGPVTLDQIRQMAGAGQITPQDLVWREGMAQWQPLASIPELAGASPAAFPPPYSTPYSPQAGMYPTAPYPQAPGQGTNGLAITGFVISLVSVPCCGFGFILGPVGAILGYVALGQMKRSGNPKGHGLAVAAIIIGIIMFLISAIMVPLQWHEIQSQLHQIR
jgi:hypothetical protein